jgi:N-acetylglucosamine kinase-like BadF-type ATPase
MNPFLCETFQTIFALYYNIKNMIIVADSGSSKCDWIVYNNKDEQQTIQTIGFNPWHHSEAFIEEHVSVAFGNFSINEIEAVYFYGSGSSTDERKLMVKNALQNVFTSATISVSHDLEASAIATCGNKEGLACILGTGSNICHWSGISIVQHDAFFGLGYILGDEGSGCAMGKQLIRDFLYCKMPEEISLQLIKLGLNKDEIINKVYTQKGANVYLASFTRFIYENKNHPYLQNLIHQTFDEFIKSHVLTFSNYTEIPCNFVGSVAYIFQEELKQVADKYKVRIDTIIKQPIENLLNYHLNK